MVLPCIGIKRAKVDLGEDVDGSVYNDILNIPKKLNVRYSSSGSPYRPDLKTLNQIISNNVA